MENNVQDTSNDIHEGTSINKTNSNSMSSNGK